jgi:hypothetical protein
MNHKVFCCALLSLFVLLISLGFSQEPVLDTESLKLIKGSWSIWRGNSQAKSSYEFTDTQALLIKGAPCYQLFQVSPEGKKPGVYTIFKVKGQTYLAFGWPTMPGKNAEKLDKAFLFSFSGTNQFEIRAAPDDPDKIVCKRK